MTINKKEIIYNDFIKQNPDYKKYQIEAINILYKYIEDKDFLINEINNECFSFLILGIIDRLYYDEQIINDDIYNKLKKIVDSLAKFNYFNYYHKKLFNNKLDLNEDEIIQNKLYI